MCWIQEKHIRKKFPSKHHKYLKFYMTRNTECSNIPQGSCNFVFSWDTFVFFTQQHVQQYLHDIKRVMIPGGYCFIQYADCHYDQELDLPRGVTGTTTQNCHDTDDQGRRLRGCRNESIQAWCQLCHISKPGKQNPVVYKFLK